ncbi:UNVERIFIED_CONTAM: hypothetical protein BEN50_03365 [Euhalothece sp. KZN 001]
MKNQQFFLAFLVLTGISSPALASVAESTPIVQADKNGLELLDRAQNKYQNQRFKEATELFQEATIIFAQQNEPLNQAMALSNLSLSYQKLGEFDAAKEAIKESLELLANQPNNSEVLAPTLDIYGQLELQLGQAAVALETWEKAETIYEALGDRAALTQNRINQGEALQSLGLYPRACQILLETLEINQGNCQIDVADIEKFDLETISLPESKALLSLGNIFRIIGNLEQSEALLTLVTQSPELIPELESKTLLNLGNTKQALSVRSQEFDEDEKAKTYQSEALKNYQEVVRISDSSLLKVQGGLNQLKILIEQGKWNLAEDIITEFNTELKTLPVGQKSIYAQVQLAEQLVCLQERKTNCSVITPSGEKINSKQHEDSLKLLKKAVEKATKIEDARSRSYALGSLGHLYEQLGNRKLAIKNTQEAVKIAQSIQAEDITYQWHWQLGRLYRETNPETAANYYQLAFNTLTNLRGELVALNPEVRFAFRENVEPIYREYADLLLTPEKVSQQNLEQARKVIEALRLAELDNFFRDACLEAEETELEEIDPKAAVFYTIIFADRVEIITAFPQQPLQNYSTQINEEELNLISQQISQQLASNPRSLYVRPTDTSPKETLDNLQSSLEELYQELIRPVEQQLQEQEIETLVFVMDGLLRNIPPSALYDGENYLIQKGYRIGFAPSLQLVKPETLKGKEIRALLGGISKSVRTFDPLPEVEKELANISTQINESQVILNEDFTEANLEQKISQLPYQIIHLATHGEFSSNAEETFILAYDDKININELKQLLNQTPDSSIPIELLVLSACQTAAGDDRAILGLAGVAVQAGARSTLASLWYVSDDATSVLMSTFYQELTTPNITKSEAFRRAQLKVLENERFSHPYFWSAFVMVGNWL